MWPLVALQVVLALGAREPLVDLQSVHPNIRMDLRYATAANFTGRVIYPVARCFLRRAVAERLARVERDLAAEGLGLAMFDCYRPLSAQRLLWSLVPDERYVANPANGSHHNRGAAVDLTLVTAAGAKLPMPTGFDDFSERAHRDFRGVDETARKNRERLERAMTARGFVPLATEWWHFDAPDWPAYPLADVDLRALAEDAGKRAPPSPSINEGER
ncbi:MAG TPA: D-alanyl-D-alanine dipeptidase [Polyangia bacterium]|nr:D-alanyl-D-alanine dipeptidase [Polyangia bacterium]